MRVEGTCEGHRQRLLQAPTPVEESLPLSPNSQGTAPDGLLSSQWAGWCGSGGDRHPGIQHQMVRAWESVVAHSFSRGMGWVVITETGSRRGKHSVHSHLILIVMCVLTGEGKTCLVNLPPPGQEPPRPGPIRL